MKRFVLAAGMLSAAVFTFGQDGAKILETYRADFAAASIEAKIRILQDAAAGPSAKDLGPLFQQAVDFVLQNISLAASDARYSQLGGIGAEQIGAIGYAPARSSVLRLFLEDNDASVRAGCATTLGVIGQGDPEVVKGLNGYLQSRNTIAVSGKADPDIRVVPAVLQALGRLGDPSSFPVIFAAVQAGYSQEISRIAEEALLAIKGDLRQILTDVIRAAPARQKLAALQVTMDASSLSQKEKAQVATLALDTALHSPAASPAERAPLRDVRLAAAADLQALGWPKATGLLIENLDVTIGEVDRGVTEARSLVGAIAALGGIGTHEAAVRLTQYLVALNSSVEQGQPYDEQIVQAVIQSLGALGDKVAFDSLMYTQHLNYSSTIRKGARSALDKLKW